MRSLVACGAIALGLCLGGCSATTDDGASSDDSDLTKRVNPQSGSAAFELKKPAWQTPAFQMALTFDGATAEYGKRYDRAGGKYNLSSGILYYPLSYGFGFRGGSMNMEVPLDLGMIAIYEPSGFVIRYAKPINAGKSNISATRANVRVVTLQQDELRTKPEGYSLVMLDGVYDFETSADAKQTFKVVEGEKKELILPVASLKLAYESVDPSFPGTTGCLTITARADSPTTGQVYEGVVTSRESNSYVLPAGSYASLQLDACGEPTRTALAPNGTIAIDVHRLEVDDVEVVDPDGKKRIVRGTFQVDRKRKDGTWTRVISGIATHSGVDVTDGTYRVTSSAAQSRPSVIEILVPLIGSRAEVALRS